jgi:hypothetical protein
MIRRCFGALLCASIAVMMIPSAAQAAFGFVPGSVTTVAENEDGSIARQAGSHPYAYNVSFAFNTGGDGLTEGGEPRDIIAELSPGLVGNPLAVPRCTRQQYEGALPKCAPNTVVGVLRALLPNLGEVNVPIFNLEPPPGTAGQLGAGAQNLNVLQNASVDTENGYGLVVGAFNIPTAVISGTETIWGFPADSSHDPERGGQALDGGPPVSSDAPKQPFLTLPTSCEAPLRLTLRADSKLAPGAFEEESAESLDSGGNPAALTGCESVPFDPRIVATTTTRSAESSSGLGFKLTLPNQGLLSPGAISESQPKKTEVALPEGVVVNPSAANGIEACTLAQYKATTTASLPGQGCPQGSKIGTLVAKTPLLEEPIEGSIYLAAPHDNPFNSLIAIYIIARAPERGVLVKQAGEVRANPTTGQLTTIVDGLPPLPYSSFEVNLREGPRAPLITPQTCGSYLTGAKLYPFSNPAAPVSLTSPSAVTSGAGGGACASNPSQLPNKPSFAAGTLTPIAGSYSPFVFKVSRQDGDQRFSSIQATLPEGLVGKLAGIPYCSESQIAAAAARSGQGEGALERNAPSCPAASEVGIVNVGAGAGSEPYYVQGRAYLAGPYKGAPLSLAIVTPAIAGPFDLGVVVVRTALYVNETTAQITAVSDPIPTILYGIPLPVRSVALNMNRPDFTLNPTNCNPMAVLASTTSTLGQTAALSSRFQVGACGALGFKPKLALSLKGGTRRTQHPTLKAVVTYPKGSYSNIARASVTLPRLQFIDPDRVANPCTRPQFAAGACPKSSILGTATAYSPLLAKPLKGKVYFRANGGERELPDVVADLNGQVHFVLVGYVDAVVKKGTEISRVRNTFATVPDAPVSKFVLQLKGGKEGLLQNSGNLCAKPISAAVRLTAHNARTRSFNQVIATSCKK